MQYTKPLLILFVYKKTSTLYTLSLYKKTLPEINQVKSFSPTKIINHRHISTINPIFLFALQVDLHIR